MTHNPRCTSFRIRFRELSFDLELHATHDLKSEITSLGHADVRPLCRNSEFSLVPCSARAEAVDRSWGPPFQDRAGPAMVRQIVMGEIDKLSQDPPYKCLLWPVIFQRCTFPGMLTITLVSRRLLAAVAICTLRTMCVTWQQSHSGVGWGSRLTV